MQKKTRKILISIMVIVACVAAIQCLRFLSTPTRENPFRMSSKRIEGNPNAPFKIIEYVDYRCGPCGFGSRWLKGFMDKHPDKIFLEVRYFPLHLSHGALSSRFAECALRQGKFWPVHDALMEQQAKWVGLPNPEDFFIGIAKQKRLDIDVLKVCWNNPRLYDEVMVVKHKGEDLGVHATPTYFVNGKMAVGARGLAKELGVPLDVENHTKKAK